MADTLKELVELPQSFIREGSQVRAVPSLALRRQRR